MDIVKKSIIIAAAFVTTLGLASVLLPREEEKNSEASLRVGAGDDISGLFLEEVGKEAEGGFVLDPDAMESYEFKDC